MMAAGGGKVPAVFLDRDGTLIAERNYLCRPEDVVLLPGAAEAVGRLNRAGFRVVVVTNQSGVARGFFGLEQVDRVHRHIDRLLARHGAVIDAYYVCPHHPAAGEPPWRRDCACRKPKPGLLLQAAAAMHLDLSRSFMIGDKLADVEAGRAAGCRPILVRTGYGAAELARSRGDVETVADLPAAVRLVLRA